MNNYLDIPEIVYEREIASDLPRVIDLSKSFRYLGVHSPEKKTITILHDISFKFGQVNVIYGKSGTGKSSLLNKIKEQLGGVDLGSLQVQDDIVINMVGKDLKDAIGILTTCGLGQGNLFLHKYSQLSDGQKFRMKLAMLLDSNDNTILYIDEFGSMLDESTSLALACTLNKYVRKNNFTLFVCSNNLEVGKRFRPDTFISLDYDAGFEIDYSLNDRSSSDLDIEITEGDISDYKFFKRYHYLSEDGCIDNAKTLVAKRGDERIGIQLLNPALSKKREVLHPFFKVINDNIVTGHRIVVCPEYMGCGIGKQLTQSVCKRLGYPIYETRSTMFYYSPVPFAWGMTEFDYRYFKERPCYDELEKYVTDLGFESYKFVNKEYALECIQKADRNKLSYLLKKVADERHMYQLVYYIALLKKIGIHSDTSVDELCQILVSIDKEPDTDEKIWVELKKYSEAEFKAFYFINRSQIG